MITPDFFIDTLRANDIDFFVGVPDSLLKNMCAYISDHLGPAHHIIAANEGGAVGVAAGYHLATGRIGCVYMQNSGEGNSINPLASLTDKEVYGIPVLLLIGWRGRPGIHDEPQHVKQGKITTGLLETMGISYAVLAKDADAARKQITRAVGYMQATHEVYALVIEKDTFAPYTARQRYDNGLHLSREDAIRTVTSLLGAKDVIVSTTGMISRELFEYRAGKGEGHERDFLTVGSMGHASQIALGIALQQPERRIWCFDGDGAVIMHMGGMAIVGGTEPRNYVHVVFNNGAHDSVGGQPTVGLKADLCMVAKALGYKAVFSTDNNDDLVAVVEEAKKREGPVFIQVCVRKGSRPDLGRPTTTPAQNKDALMTFLKD